MDNVELLKVEAVRLVTMILCQGATAGKGSDKPTPNDVLTAAKAFHAWFIEKS